MTDPRITHHLEQTQAVLRDLAPVLGSYMDALLAHGFERSEAFKLVMEAQHRMIYGVEPDLEDVSDED